MNLRISVDRQTMPMAQEYMDGLQSNSSIFRQHRADLLRRLDLSVHWPSAELTRDSTLLYRSILESQHLRLAVSRGPIAPVHLLIVEKQPSGLRAFAELPSDILATDVPLLLDAAKLLCHYVSGHTIWLAFEHGVFSHSRRVACGTDAAHLHVVACNKSTEAAVRAFSERWRIGSDWNCRRMQSAGCDEYLCAFADEWSRTIYFANHPCQSQLLRKLIRTAEFSDDAWNWKRTDDGPAVAQMTRVLDKAARRIAARGGFPASIRVMSDAHGHSSCQLRPEDVHAPA